MRLLDVKHRLAILALAIVGLLVAFHLVEARNIAMIAPVAL